MWRLFLPMLALTLFVRVSSIIAEEPPQSPAPKVNPWRPNLGSQFEFVQFIRPVPSKSPSPENTEFHLAITIPVSLRYLEQLSVRAELKLTEEQTKKLADLRKSWIKASLQNGIEAGTVETHRQLMKAIPKQIEEAISAEQNTRLNQIMLRHREREYGLPSVLAFLANDLALTDQQRQEFDALRRKRAEMILEHLTSPDRYDVVRRKVYESNRAHVDEVEQLLTEAQRGKLKNLLGAPFRGEIQLAEPEFVRLQAQPLHYIGRLFNHYALEPEMLLNESVQQELKMADDQVRKAKEFHVEWAAKIEKGRKKNADPIEVVLALDDYVTENLAKVLKRSQRSRFRSIAMQHREKLGGKAAGCGHPEAFDILKITERQQELLHTGEFEKALDESQKSFYNNLIGAAFKGEIKFDTSLALVRDSDLRIQRPTAAVPRLDSKEFTLAGYMVGNSRQFRLTDEQIARLKEIDEDTPKLRQLLHKELSNLPPPTDITAIKTILPEAKAVEHYRKSIVERCLEVLDNKQQSLYGAEIRRASANY